MSRNETDKRGDALGYQLMARRVSMKRPEPGRAGAPIPERRLKFMPGPEAAGVKLNTSQGDPYLSQEKILT